MAAGIVYLDVDDEITSAAARIRSSTATRVALVVPYGSRIATSRMNFRLLSREALVSNRRLSIVAGDAASRSLAASAGLPVFASVAEYEGAVDAGSSGPDAGAATPPKARRAATTLAESETVAAVGPDHAGADETQAIDVAAAGAAAVGASASAPPSPPPVSSPRAPGGRARPRTPSPRATPPPPPAPPAARDARLDDRDLDEGREAGPRRLALGTPLLIALGLAGLAVVVLAVGAYLFLPAATIAVTPRQEPISVQLTVAADPTATTVDATTGVVPAVRLDVPVQASQTFTTTGVHVEQTAASGEVTFSNYNPVSSNTIPGGSIVSTEGGIRFRTLATVTVPAGTFVLPSVIPAKRNVAVQAVKAGTEGNVPANSIRVVPQGENPDFLKVNNNDPTSGGTRTETPEVSKAEVDKAVATLQAQLQTAFDDAVAGGAGAPPDTTVFPRTAILGEVTPSVDPKTLVGQAIPTFDLGLAATGSVIAVDPTPVRAIAEQQLSGRVGPGHRLVDGSVQVDVGEGTVEEDGQVTFDATARGTQVAELDPAQLKALVKGKTKAQAEAALAPFGDVRVDLWPSWVTTVTGMDARLSVTIQETPAVGPSGASPPASPTVRPGASPRRSSAPSASGGSSAGSAAP
jgi:hypothetical protein